MDSISQSSDKVPSLKTVAGLLAAINVGVKNDKSGAGPFAKLLHSHGADVSANIKANTKSSGDNGSDDLPSLKKLAKALHKLLENTQSEKDNTPVALLHKATKTADKQDQADNSNVVKKDDASQSNANILVVQNPVDEKAPVIADQIPAPQIVCKPEVAASANTEQTTGDDQSDISDADLLAALQLLIRTIEKQIATTQTPQNVDGDSKKPVAAVEDKASPVASADALLSSTEVADQLVAAPATQPAQSTDAPVVPPVVGTQKADTAKTDKVLQSIVRDLQKFAQIVAQQQKTDADAIQTNTMMSADAPVQTVAAVPVAPVLDAQLRNDLKEIVDALQMRVAPPKAPDVNLAAAAPDNVADLASDEVVIDYVIPSLAGKKPHASLPVLNTDTSLTPERLATVFAPPTNAAGETAVNASFVALPSYDSNGKSGASSDFDTKSGNRDTATNTGNAPTDAKFAQASNVPSATSPYSFASQLSATRATTGGTAGLPSAVEQVVLQLHRNVKSGNDQMTLQLNPGDLGRVHIKLDFLADGKVQGMVMADNPATLDTLLKDVRGLERALQEAGLRADSGSLQFSLSGQQQQTAGQNADKKSSGNGDAKTDSLSALATAADTETYYLTPGRVNLRV